MKTFIKRANKKELINRLDCIYWTPTNLNLNNKIKYAPLKSLLSQNDNIVTSAFYPSITPFYQTKGVSNTIPFLKSFDVNTGMETFENTTFLSKQLLKKNKASIKHVTAGDIVISKGGEYLGQSWIVPREYQDYSISRDVLGIKMENASISTPYLASFLQSKLGRESILRTKSIQGQPHITTKKIKNLRVPLIKNQDFIKNINNLWQSYTELNKQASNELKCATHILNDKLQFTTDDSKKKFVKKIKKQSLSKRMDLEYYQASWSNLIHNLTKKGIKFSPVNISTQKIAKLKDDDPNKIYEYITLSSVDARSGIINKTKKLPAKELPGRAQMKLSKGDVLVPSLRGSAKNVAIISSDNNNLVGSNGFFVLRNNILNPETIYALLRTPFYSLFLNQMANGSIMPSLSNKYFKEFQLPFISAEVQSKIKRHITLYFSKKDDSLKCIDEAAKTFDEILEIQHSNIE